ncbi:MAG: hypothetical protein PVI66_14540 [Candidatus Aminicenantes bacterium]|jgi:hypothetical protein
MELRLLFVAIALILIVLIPIAPKLIRFRIAVFRKLKWNCLANFHEKHFDQLIIVVRVILALIIAILVFLILLA